LKIQKRIIALCAIFIIIFAGFISCKGEDTVITKTYSCFGCEKNPCICQPLPETLEGKWYATQDAATELQEDKIVYDFAPKGILFILGVDNGTTYRIEDNVITVKFGGLEMTVPYVISGTELKISGSAFLLQAGTYYKPGPPPPEPHEPGTCYSCKRPFVGAAGERCPFDETNIWSCLVTEAGFTPGSGGLGAKIAVPDDDGNYLPGDFIGHIYKTEIVSGKQANPTWATEIGDYFLFSYTDTNGRPTGLGPVATEEEFFGDVLMSFSSGAMLGVFFENYIDASDASTLNLSIFEGSGSNWSGGIVFIHNSANPRQPLQAQWWNGSRDINDKYVFGLKNFRLLGPDHQPIAPGNPAGDPDFTKLVGFALKSNGYMIVTDIDIIDLPPLYVPKECDCDLYHPILGSYPMGGERQLSDPDDHYVLRNAPPYSYLAIYFSEVGTSSPGRLGPSSSVVHMANCPCGNPPGAGNIQLLSFPLATVIANGMRFEVPITTIWKFMECQGDGSDSNRFVGNNFNINPFSGGVIADIVLHTPKEDPRPECPFCGVKGCTEHCVICGETDCDDFCGTPVWSLSEVLAKYTEEESVLLQLPDHRPLRLNSSDTANNIGVITNSYVEVTAVGSGHGLAISIGTSQDALALKTAENLYAIRFTGTVVVGGTATLRYARATASDFDGENGTSTFALAAGQPFTITSNLRPTINNPGNYSGDVIRLTGNAGLRLRYTSIEIVDRCPLP